MVETNAERMAREAAREGRHEAQAERTTAYATSQGYLPYETIRDCGVSGTIAPERRPGLARTLAMLAAGDAAVLIVASLSRLGRNVGDVLGIAARADREGWALAILDLGVDTATPTGRFSLTVLAAVAQLERDQISERTTAALAVKKAQGARLGRPASDATRAAGHRAAELRADGSTWQQVCEALTAEQFHTARGGRWSITQARRAARTVELDAHAAAAGAER